MTTAKALGEQQQQTRQTESLSMLSTKVNQHADLLNNHATVLNEQAAMLTSHVEAIQAIQREVTAMHQVDQATFSPLLVLVCAVAFIMFVLSGLLYREIKRLEGKLRSAAQLPTEKGKE